MRRRPRALVCGDGQPVTGLAGYRSAAVARSTGTLVLVLEARPAGVDSDPDHPWATVCDPHGGLCTHPTLTLARHHAPCPEEWCPTCQEMGPLDPGCRASARYLENPDEARRSWARGFRPMPAEDLRPGDVVEYRATDVFGLGPEGPVMTSTVTSVSRHLWVVKVHHGREVTEADESDEVWAKREEGPCKTTS